MSPQTVGTDFKARQTVMKGCFKCVNDSNEGKQMTFNARLDY